VAHIRKLEGGRWQARYRNPDDRREIAHNFKTKTAAQDWLDEVTAGRVRNDYVDPRAGRVRVGTYAERWYDATVVLKPKTRLGYRQILDVHVLPRWGTVELRAVTASGISAWVAQIASKRSASTTRKALGVLRGVLDLAVADRRVAVNPTVRVKQPRLPLAEQRFLTADDLMALAEATTSERDRLLVLVLGWCGLRFGEAIALQSSDVDVLRRRIRVERSAVEVGAEIVVGAPKTHQARTVTVPRFLADNLAACMTTVDPSGLLFPDERGGYVRNTNWRRRAFDPAATRAKLTPLRVHDLRHTAASLSIHAGASVKAVQSQLGHRSATMTLDRYGHLWPDELDALSDALDVVAARSAADSVRTSSPSAEVVALADRR
jgi:integrase